MASYYNELDPFAAAAIDRSSTSPSAISFALISSRNQGNDMRRTTQTTATVTYVLTAKEVRAALWEALHDASGYPHESATIRFHPDGSVTVQSVFHGPEVPDDC